MPEQENSSQVVNLNSTEPVIQIKKKMFIIVSVIVTLFVILALFGAYTLGKSSGEETTQLEKEAKVSTSSAEPEGLKKAKMGEEVEALGGISVTLESAQIDQIYEEQKKEQRQYYENYATGSAYLQSDYFKQSLLNVKIVLKNKTDKILSYSPTSFRLKDSDNNQYTAGLDGDKPVIYTLNPKETTKITVSYTVPTDEATFKLIYENVEIRFSLP